MFQQYVFILIDLFCFGILFIARIINTGFLHSRFVLFETGYQAAHQDDSKMPNGKVLGKAFAYMHGDTTGTYQEQ